MSLLPVARWFESAAQARIDMGLLFIKSVLQFSGLNKNPDPFTLVGLLLSTLGTGANVLQQSAITRLNLACLLTILLKISFSIFSDWV